MALPLRFLSIPMIVFAISPFASAQERVMEAILEDCERAKIEFAALDEQSRRPLFDYFSRVVALNAQALEIPETFVVLPGAPKGNDVMIPGGPKGSDITAGTLWQTVDAKRELKAKHCALEILAAAGKSALSALPSLAKVYHEQSLSDEISVALEETIAEIAESAHKAELSPSDAELDVIVPHLMSNRPLVAENILTEYLVIALPRLLLYFSSATETEQQSILRFLIMVDPDGSRGMRVFIERAPSLPREKAIHMAAKLPFPHRDALPLFLRDFASLAIGVDSSQIFSPLLGRACLALGKLPPDIASILAPASSLLHSSSLDIDALKCLVASSHAFARTIPSLVLSTQENDIERGIALLPSALPHLDQDTRNTLFSHLRALAVRPGPHQLGALELLSSFSERGAEARSTYINLLSSAIPSSMPSTLHSTILKILADTQIPKDKDFSKIVKIVGTALESGSEIEVAMKVAAKAQLTQMDLLPFVSGEQLDRSRRILRSLIVPDKPDRKSLPALVELIRTPELYRELRPLLLPYKGALVPLVRKIYPKLSGDARLVALAIMEEVVTISKQELGDLAGLYQREGCDSIALAPEAARSLLRRGEQQQAPLPAIQNKIQSCALRIPTSSLRALELMAEDMPPQEELQRDLEAGVIPQETISYLLEHDGPHIVSEELRRTLFVWVLNKGGKQARAAVLSRIKAPEAPQVLAAVRELASDGGEFAISARGALARAGDSDYDWRDFLRNTIERAGEGAELAEELRIVRLLPPEVVLAQVSPNLESSSNTKIIGSCRVGAALGSQAIPIVSKIWHLREKRSPSVRYAAVLALLEINPLTPDLQEQVRRLLVNRYFSSALSRKIRWGQTVALVDLDKSAFGTLRTVHLERLLASSEES